MFPFEIKLGSALRSGTCIMGIFILQSARISTEAVKVAVYSDFCEIELYFFEEDTMSIHTL